MVSNMSDIERTSTRIVTRIVREDPKVDTRVRKGTHIEHQATVVIRSLTGARLDSGTIGRTVFGLFSARLFQCQMGLLDRKAYLLLDAS
jgi:hypothetical protein